jgi:hypothetical protein
VGVRGGEAMRRREASEHRVGLDQSMSGYGHLLSGRKSPLDLTGCGRVVLVPAADRRNDDAGVGEEAG